VACHSDEEMKATHAAEEIYSFDNCMECHLPGFEGEITNPPVIGKIMKP
jgi:hypothetical protein